MARCRIGPAPGIHRLGDEETRNVGALRAPNLSSSHTPTDREIERTEGKYELR